jgi:hypothetical protein
MPYDADPGVDAHIDALPDWQQSSCRQVRDLVRAVDPDVVAIITAGHDNKTAGTMAVYRDEAINATAFKVMVAQIIANNRAAG